MQVRFDLDEKFDARLINRIKGRANGGSLNKAARFLMRYWLENENLPVLTANCHAVDILGSVACQDQTDTKDQLTNALTNIDDAW